MEGPAWMDDEGGEEGGRERSTVNGDEVHQIHRPLCTSWVTEEHESEAWLQNLHMLQPLKRFECLHPERAEHANSE